MAKSSVFKTRKFSNLLSSHLRFWVSFDLLSSQGLIFKLPKHPVTPHLIQLYQLTFVFINQPPIVLGMWLLWIAKQPNHRDSHGFGGLDKISHLKRGPWVLGPLRFRTFTGTRSSSASLLQLRFLATGSPSCLQLRFFATCSSSFLQLLFLATCSWNSDNNKTVIILPFTVIQVLPGVWQLDGDGARNTIVYIGHSTRNKGSWYPHLHELRDISFTKLWYSMVRNAY